MGRTKFIHSEKECNGVCCKKKKFKILINEIYIWWNIVLNLIKSEILKLMQIYFAIYFFPKRYRIVCIEC